MRKIIGERLGHEVFGNANALKLQAKMDYMQTGVPITILAMQVCVFPFPLLWSE
ncbi:hypothetical protein DSM19430T_17080 [Desulfovibrio psychrotolerans]|uniref:Uncharacterized protein n=1 Tax=Desulfovibrio psychrotolerans TaxID=415242 RepID=A0A7J0BVJ9_9BACT|nr:hypothetical protein DSM19430T_17080 [Desulfovibrio psychrotolerans]